MPNPDKYFRCRRSLKALISDTYFELKRRFAFLPPILLTMESQLFRHIKNGLPHTAAAHRLIMPVSFRHHLFFVFQ